MKLSKIRAVYFSPVGSTEKVVLSLAESLSELLGLPVARLDYTLPHAREAMHSFDKTDLVVWGTPVYAGRTPNKLLPYVQSHFIGNGALAVPIAVFGNRSFDDALLELHNALESNGFHTLAAAAVAAQHSFSKILAAGRPDAQDSKQIKAFAEQIAEKIRLSEGCFQAVEVPGNQAGQVYYTPKGVDGKPTSFLKAKPSTDLQKCSRCGICIRRCPMGSIHPDDPSDITGICIKCHACVKRCPKEAKRFEDAQFLSHKQMLERDFAHRVEPAFFL